MTALKVSAAQRQARLAERHHLAEPAGSVAAAAAAMVALHATDPWTVYLSGRARVPAATLDEVDAAIYADRVLVRILGMRRTMWVVPTGLLDVVQRGCTDDVAKRMRRQLEKDLAAGGVGGGDAAGWLRDVEAGVLRALDTRGSAAGAELSADEPRLRTQLTYAEGKNYGGPANITSRVLMLMSADGQIIRGHRRGGWSSGQFTWHRPDAWLGGAAGPDRADDSGRGAGGPASGTSGSAGGTSGSAGGTSGSADPAVRHSDGASSAAAAGAGLDAGLARAELARRWLRAFGPAPVSDLQWWAGWTAGQTKAALTAIDVGEADLDGRPGVILAGDVSLPEAPPPAAALLPALDPTPMGWQSREWYLGPHAPVLFDRTGNIGPTVWWAGRVVGGWAQRASGEIAFRLLEDIGSDATSAVTTAAGSLQAWLGQSRVTPRFRTPLERELSS